MIFNNQANINSCRYLTKLKNKNDKNSTNIFDPSKHNLVPLIKQDLIESNDGDEKLEKEKQYNSNIKSSKSKVNFTTNYHRTKLYQ